MEIREEHVEWATVHRMREMLSATDGEFEVTLAFSLFTGILCWTMQSLRPDEHDHDRISEALRGCAGRIAELPISRFLKVQPRELDMSSLGSPGIANKVLLNSFQDFRDPKTGHQFDAFRCLKALRNAIGHGDAKRVIPVNKEKCLIGYTFICSEAHMNKDGNWVGTWAGRVCLDRRAMVNVGCELADQYCSAIAAVSPGLVIDARTVRERR